MVSAAASDGALPSHLRQSFEEGKVGFPLPDPPPPGEGTFGLVFGMLDKGTSP
jgi:hypothetical protein